MTPLTPERIAAIRANIGAERPSWVLAGVITELLDHIEEQAREIERYRGALTTIREQHGICERGELCCRGACRTCYEVWQVADTALRGEAASDA